MRALRLHYLAPLGLWLAAVALISLAEGTPDPPPAVALGSTALLHASLARPGREALDALDQGPDLAGDMADPAPTTTRDP